MSTTSTIPRVMHVVPLPLLETDDRFFLLDRVEDRFSVKCQLDSLGYSGTGLTLEYIGRGVQ